MKKIVNVSVICIVLFVLVFGVATFADLKIAEVVYNSESLFGRFFQIVGTLPLPIVGIFATEALVLSAKRKVSVSTIASYVIGALMFIYFAFYGVECIANALSVAKIPMIICTAVWAIVSGLLIRRIISEGKSDGLRFASIISVSSSVMASIGVTVVKNIMYRPRFYTLTNPEQEFTYWFQKQSYTAQAENYVGNTSFPSGHSAQAALIFCFLLIPLFVEMRNAGRYYKVMGIISVVFTLCVMFSRMVLGMHYATDVLAGAVLPFVAAGVTYGLMYMLASKNESCRIPA